MTILWVVSGAALVVALVAWLTARRTARRLAQLSEMYWALKYQHLELRNQLQRTTDAGTPTVSTPASAPAARSTESFVPLTSLRR
jgi:hypothetical protein